MLFHHHCFYSFWGLITLIGCLYAIAEFTWWGISSEFFTQWTLPFQLIIISVAISVQKCKSYSILKLPVSWKRSVCLLKLDGLDIHFHGNPGAQLLCCSVWFDQDPSKISEENKACISALSNQTLGQSWFKASLNWTNLPLHQLYYGL